MLLETVLQARLWPPALKFNMQPNDKTDQSYRKMMNKAGGKGGSMVKAANRYIMTAEEKKNKLSNTS